MTQNSQWDAHFFDPFSPQSPLNSQQQQDVASLWKPQQTMGLHGSTNLDLLADYSASQPRLDMARDVEQVPRRIPDFIQIPPEDLPALESGARITAYFGAHGELEHVFTLGSFLGGGNNGKVFQVSNTEAVKILDKIGEEDDRFLAARAQRELYIGAAIAHRLREKGVQDNKDYLQGFVLPTDMGHADTHAVVRRRRVLRFPLISGMNLEDFVKQRLDALIYNVTKVGGEERTEERIRDFKLNIWRLQAAHLSSVLCTLVSQLNTVGIYHRDIKLDNFFVSDINPKYQALSEGVVHLIDFGNACSEPVYNGSPVANLELFRCSRRDDATAFSYEPALLYADPRTYTRLNTDPLPRLSLSLRAPLSSDGSRYPVLYPVGSLTFLAPAFEAYSLAVCAQFIIDRQQRRTRLPTTTVEFREGLMFPAPRNARPLFLQKSKKEFYGAIADLSNQIDDRARNIANASARFLDAEKWNRSYQECIDELADKDYVDEATIYFRGLQLTEPEIVLYRAFFDPKIVTEVTYEQYNKKRKISVARPPPQPNQDDDE
jgi:serine/threonine protein kinase